MNLSGESQGNIVTTVTTAVSSLSRPLTFNFGLKCTATAGLQSAAGKLPSDVMMIQAEFMHYDWAKLLEVFPEREDGANREFCDYVRRCMEARRLVPDDRYIPLGCGSPPIQLDPLGNIKEIFLINQQLRDSAIGDLSKLPSTLQRLSLAGNQIHQLTTLDVASLPRDLKILFVRNNQLTELDLLRLPRRLEYLGVEGNNLTELDVTKLPPTLITLMAGHNKLSAIDLTKLPPRLDTLSLTNNNLQNVDLSQLPPVMWYVGLSRNYLDDSHFETLPSDRAEIQLRGKGNQRRLGSVEIKEILEDI